MFEREFRGLQAQRGIDKYIDAAFWTFTPAFAGQLTNEIEHFLDAADCKGGYENVAAPLGECSFDDGREFPRVSAVCDRGRRRLIRSTISAESGGSGSRRMGRLRSPMSPENTILRAFSNCRAVEPPFDRRTENVPGIAKPRARTPSAGRTPRRTRRRNCFRQRSTSGGCCRDDFLRVTNDLCHSLCRALDARRARSASWSYMRAVHQHDRSSQIVCCRRAKIGPRKPLAAEARQQPAMIDVYVRAAARNANCETSKSSAARFFWS